MANIKKEFFNAIEEITQTEGTYFPIDENVEFPIIIAQYSNIPEENHLTSFSFGLSSIQHKEWVASSPELIISVQSGDSSWALAMGEIVSRVNKDSLFEYGTILNFGETISDESEMSAFFIFANSLLDNDDAFILLSDRKVHFSQLYPIYDAEIAVIKAIGSEEFFFNRDVDFFNIKRHPVLG